MGFVLPHNAMYLQIRNIPGASTWGFKGGFLIFQHLMFEFFNIFINFEIERRALKVTFTFF